MINRPQLRHSQQLYQNNNLWLRQINSLRRLRLYRSNFNNLMLLHHLDHLHYPLLHNNLTILQVWRCLRHWINYLPCRACWFHPNGWRRLHHRRNNNHLECRVSNRVVLRQTRQRHSLVRFPILSYPLKTWSRKVCCPIYIYMFTFVNFTFCPSTTSHGKPRAGTQAVGRWLPKYASTARYREVRVWHINTWHGTHTFLRPKYYIPKNPYPTPIYYPQTPNPVLSSPTLFQNLDIETLFYVFYYLPGTYQQ